MKTTPNFPLSRIRSILCFTLLKLCSLYQVFGLDVSGSVSGVWSLDNSPYVVTGDVVVPGGQTLSIRSGVEVRFASNSADLVVDGVLLAIGTASSPIVFTTNQAEPAPNQWGQISFRNTNLEESSRLEHCHVSYGGGFRNEMIHVNRARVGIRHCELSWSGRIGINILDADPVVQDCQFHRNTSYPLAMSPGSSPIVSGNQANDNGSDVIGIHGGTITGMTQWRKDDLPYRIINDVTVLVDAELIIAPGVKVEFEGVSDDLFVNGSIIAKGSSTERIRFTSSNPDKAPEQWGHISVRDSSNDERTQFLYCDFEYGGGFRSELLLLQQSSPTIEHCRFIGSRDRGLSLQGSSSRLASNQFISNRGYAVVMDLLSFPDLENNSAEGNGGNSIGILGGTLSGSGTWQRDEIPYTITNDIIVSEDTTLNVEAGTQLQFQDASDDFIVDGALVADGNVQQPIVFTSDNEEKAPDQWGFVWFRDSSSDETSILRHCRFEFGGSFREDMLRIQDASPKVESCVFQFSRQRGLTLLNSNSEVSDSQFSNNASYAIVKDLRSFPELSGNMGSNNAGGSGDAIGILSGTLTESGSWVRDELPYTIIDDVVVQENAVLTIQPGVIIQFQDLSDDLVIDGTFKAEGTVDLPIIFTSNNEEKGPDQWGYIWVRDPSPDAETIFKHCRFEYGGGFRDEMLRIQQTSPRIEHCVFASSRSRGITLMDSKAVLLNNQFINNRGYALVMLPDSFPILSGNQASGNADGIGNTIGIWGGTLNGSGTWGRDEIPYTIMNDVVIGPDHTLVIASGTTVQFQDSSDDLVVQGGLRALSTPEAPILFTSNDAEKSGRQWGRIFVRDSSRDEDTIFENVIIEYGSGSANAQFAVENASPTIRRLISRFSGQDGMYLTGSSPEIQSSRFEDNAGSGIRTAVKSQPVIRDSVFKNNRGSGVDNTDPSVVVDASGNFWGDPTGPLDTLDEDGLGQINESSEGDKVSEFVRWGGPLMLDPPFMALEAEIQIEPTSLDFGEVVVNETVQRNLNISNTGNFTLNIQSLTFSNVAFSTAELTLPWSIGSGDSVEFPIYFSPGVTGLNEGNLVIDSTDFRNPQTTIPLQGIGITDPGGGSGDPIRSSFDAGIEGWKAVGFSIDPPFNKIIDEPIDVTFLSDGGNPGGHIMQEDVRFSVGYFSAPAEYLGDQSTFIGGRLSFDTKISPPRSAFSVPEVILLAGDRSLVFDLTPTPTDQWQAYTIELRHDAGWKVDSPSGNAPSESEFQTILSSLTGLFIRSEYISGPDQGFLDNVVFNNGDDPPPPPKPSIRFQPESILFGTVEVGESKSFDVVVSNAGDGDLIINHPSYSPGPPFEGLSDPVPITLESGQETTFLSIFRPVAAGEFSGEFRFETNDLEMPELVIPLQGVAIVSGDRTSIPLSAEKQADGSLRIFWSTELSGVELEFTDNLSAPVSWSKYSGVIQQDGFDYWTVVAIDQVQRFFKLSGDTIDHGGGGTMTPNIQIASGMVTPDQGGVISSDDSTFTFQVPPGGVDTPTEIRAKYTSLNAPEEGVTFGEFEMEPTGLVFNEPAIMRVKLPRSPTSLEELAVRSHSLNNPERNVGSELSYFQLLDDFLFDSTSQILQFNVPHFSQLAWNMENKVYLVFDFPGKYLKKGDLLYALTDAQSAGIGGDWFPGHAGLYLGTKGKSDSSNDGQTIIEATFDEDARLQAGYSSNGVRFGNLEDFKKLHGHMYMGARRPLLFEVSDEDRDKIANWAIDQLGRPYSILFGGPWANIWDSGNEYNTITCAGLTEGAYENGMGREITPEFFQPILTPFRQFIHTKPVAAVEVKEGETFEMDIDGMIRISGSYENRFFVNHEVSVVASTEDAEEFLKRPETEFGTKGFFSIKPKAGDEGKVLGYRFTINPLIPGYDPVSRFFRIDIIQGDSSDTFVRSENPILSTSSNRLSLVTRDNTSITITDGDIDYSLSWIEPPLKVREGDLINMSITASANGAPSRLQGGLSPFRTELRGWILDPIEDSLLVNPSLDDPHAFVGYQSLPSDQCDAGFRSCYEFHSMGHSQGIVVPKDFGGFRVSIAFSTFEKFNDGSRGMFERHWIAWDYSRAVVGGD